jgi:hypothetical protein
MTSRQSVCRSYQRRLFFGRAMIIAR